MGYQTNKEELCQDSYWVQQGHTEDEDGNPLVSRCEWMVDSTYSDVCKTCGAIAWYG
jgi:hypothetical protein